MYLFEDGGGIYTLSKQPGSFVSENFVHDIAIAPWAGYGVSLAFYLDEGSEGITVANNVIQNVQVGLSLQGCCGLAFGNTIINLPPDVVVMGNIGGNTFLTDSTLFPADVVANAGIEPSYRDILNGGPARLARFRYSDQQLILDRSGRPWRTQWVNWDRNLFGWISTAD